MKLIAQLFIGIVIVLSACSPPLVFDRPFPPNEDDLMEIPEKYRGVYMCESDSTLVVINKSVIYAREPYYFEESVEYIEECEDCKLVGDKLIMNQTGEEVPIEFTEEGKVRGHFIEQDTLFKFGEYSIARPYDGNLLLSISLKNKEWAIYGLTRNNAGNVVYRAINEATDLELVDDISPITELEREVADDPPRYMVRPTLADFDRMFRNERIYIECETLIRIKFDEFKKEFF